MPLPTKEVQITGDQYMVLKTLLNAACQDKDRFAITKVFYDKDRNQFVATNGHILRIEKIVWINGEPENSFFLGKKELMLNATQIRLKYGRDLETKNLEEIIFDFEYGPHEEDPAYPYPAYWNVIPKDSERFPLEWIGLNPTLIAKLNKTFYEVPRAIQFQFHGELRGVLMYDAMAVDEDRRLLGVIMPMHILGTKPAPLFELAEIQRYAPGEEPEVEGAEKPMEAPAVAT